MPKKTAAEAARTRSAILDAGRASFAEEGYGAVSLEAIAARAGVTRGAVHHHFGNKRALFVEVFSAIEEELNTHVITGALAAGPSARAQLRAGCHALFEFFDRADYRQIALGDAPGVLGLVEWYRIDRNLGLVTVRAGLDLMTADGHVIEGDLDTLALLLYGALTEAAIALGTGATHATVDGVLATVDRVIDGLGTVAASTVDR